MRKTIFIIMMMLATLLIGSVTVFAEEMYQLQWAHEDIEGRRYVDVMYWNTDKEAMAKLDKYSDEYVNKLALRVCANGSNVYDVTNKRMITKKCKGKEWFGIGYTKEKHTFHIIWIDDNDIAKLKYINDSQIYVLGAYRGEQLNALGDNVNTGIAMPSEQTISGVQKDPITNTKNVDKKIGDFYCSYDGVAYKYSIKKGVLTLTSGMSMTELSRDENVVSVGVVDKYVVYFSDNHEMYAMELGRRSSGTLIFDDVENFYYADSYVIKNVVADGENYSAEDLKSVVRNELRNK